LIGSQLDVVQTRVHRDQEDVLRTGEEWKAKMIAEGWRDVSSLQSQSAHQELHDRGLRRIDEVAPASE